MRILYLGNKLKSHGYNPTSIEVLGEKLKEIAEVIQVSEYRSPLLRFADMAKAIYTNRSTVNLVLIDTYSTRGFYLAFYCGFICRSLKLPYVPILHGGDLPKRLIRSKAKCDTFFNNAAFLVAPSGFMRKKFKQSGYTNVKLIPNQIDLNKFNFKERKAAAPRILWVRSFAAIYNPELAIDVIALLATKYPDAKLGMVGPEKNGLMGVCKAKAKKLRIEGNVEFVGKKTRKEWIELSQDYDIFLNTTNVDNTPLSVMEAMAMGMCVVTTNVGGIPYLFENEIEGVMVEPNDAEMISQGIIKIVDSPEYAHQLSCKAREKSKEWDWLFIKPIWQKHLKQFQ
ncbi:glycosyltransferase family 4 protein [Algoriphagus chordae]|uniref:Glycosyltransferase involved in cell wall biosynthesis n=1 Tax=Algoriphagus chordae TaxID=237019 RepID=A0A2W7QHE4_9BACT|nr:glycosyltransferase family 4 protein [Algoriphagus chordae]PZX47673.1 glycosyltransferase involved in cell wall biosynthesis [Algoriphagus chordae]